MTKIELGQYTSNTNSTAAAHNLVADNHAIAINQHSHDPHDGYGNDQGGPIPQWGQTNSYYSIYTSNPNIYTGAAIPADPSETTVSPIGSISASAGIAAELQRVRGQLARVTGSAWNAPIGPIVFYNSATDLNVTQPGANFSIRQLSLTAPTNTPPIVITNQNTQLVQYLNAQYVNGFSALGSAVGSVGGNNTAFAGIGSSRVIISANADGYFSPGLIEYDSAEASTFDALTAGTTSLLANLNRIRYQLAQLNIAAGAVNNANAWRSAPGTLVTTLNAQNAPALSGPVTLVPGVGIQVSNVSGGIRIDALNLGPVESTGLTYPDAFGDAVVTGLQTTAGSGLTVNIAPGIAYINGSRIQTGGQSGVSVNASTTTYVYTDGQQNFPTNTTGTPPTGTILLASVVAGSGSITSVADKRNLLKPTVTGSKGGNVALTNLCIALNAMGLINNQTT